MKRPVADLVICVSLIAGACRVSHSALGEEYKYYSKGKRDPFVSLVSGEIKTSLGLQIVETIDDVKLEGIIFDPLGASMAMLNGEVVKEGDRAYNVEVVKIYERSVFLKIYEKTFTINLAEEGGE